MANLCFDSAQPLLTDVPEVSTTAVHASLSLSPGCISRGLFICYYIDSLLAVFSLDLAHSGTPDKKTKLSFCRKGF